MIIVSQNKKTIINFNNITDINIEFIHSDYELRASFVGEKGSFNIGNYETEERAKEVLQEIVMLFKDEEMFHIRKSTLNNLDELAEPKYILKPVSRPKVFEMPEE